MALDNDTVITLVEAAEYLRTAKRNDLANAVYSAILLNADMPNALAQARSAGYQAAIFNDYYVDEWGD
jgi:hypothetical protein